MKKILLIIAAAVFAGSASAQTQSKKLDAKKYSITKVQQVGRVQVEDNVPAKLSTMKRQDVRSEVKRVHQATAQELQKMNIKPVSVAAPAKVGALANSYTGTAIEYGSNENATWQMLLGTFEEDNSPALINVIPTPFSNLAEIPVSYTQEGAAIKVPAQRVATASLSDGTTLYCYLVNIGSSVEDGSHNFTLDEDGTLTYDNYYASYCFFKEDDVNWTSLYTYYAYTNVKYVAEGVVVAPEALYEPKGVYLHANITPLFHSYPTNYAIVPAYTEVSFKNLTTDLADSWNWSVSSTDDDAEAITGTERDFSFNTIGNTAYTPVSLIASNQDKASSPFVWGLGSSGNYEKAYIFAGETADDFADEEESSIITRANPDFQIAYYSYMGTPDVNSQNYSIATLILYQGKPEAPLYFTGANLLVRDFAITAGKDLDLKLKIQKVTRSASGSITLGDVIAESDLDPEDIIYGDETNGTALLNWTSLYVEDDLGLSQPLDYLFVEDEFALVIEGWDNGTFTAIPFGEYNPLDQSPINTYEMDTDDTSIYRMTSANMIAGFNDAAYGFLYTEDNTNINIAAEGGEAKITVEPMLISQDSETGLPTTRLWLDEDSEEVPEWLEVSYVDNYVLNDAQTALDEASFDLVFKAEALPAGVEGRSVNLTFFQEGAKLTVTVAQGNAAGISVVATTTKATDSKLYNLAGQRVNKNFKGIVVKDGKKFVIK